ncbi:hybrid sensor histidine kinase/response regulator [Arenimonas composti]|uniref:Chemotaxis protein CheA n=1 Tax=Arenimonas composti TR7-09 = DSM 18010 TaxID=1121013 RepID=A0A091BCM3_9GAMM|nr:response regulator [Arenimonas composti]KFN48569.1 hypothetical protein P873_14220 [Arenimonas composti TR7-09 = DSM 18010]
MSALWPLMQQELRRLLPQLQELAGQLTGGWDAAASAQWQKRLAAFAGSTRVLGDTPLLNFVARLQPLWRSPGGRAGDGDEARTLLMALDDLAGLPFDEAMAFAASALQPVATPPPVLGDGGAPAAPPAATPASAAAVETAPASAADQRLRTLFATEMADKCQAMERVLLQLEQAPERLELIAPLMRAAHSIKGAARAVRIDPAVKLSHALEDRLSAAQKRGEALPPALLELALQAVDRLRRLGTDDGEAARQAAADTTAALLSADAGTATTAAAPAPASAAGGAMAPPADAPTYIDVEEADPILRVRASHIGRLIALAGDGIVENRRLRGFGERQLRLRRELGDSARALDELHRALGAPGADTAIGALVAGLRHRLSDARHRINHWLDEFSAFERESADLTERLYHFANQTRLRPFSDIAAAYPRVVRDLGRSLGKRVRAIVEGEQLAVDRDVLERLDAPLTHLLRNAVDHGIEAPAVRLAAGKPEEGTLRISASYRAGMLAIEVADDGAGVDYAKVRKRWQKQRGLDARAAAALDEEALAETLFVAGFSTRDEVSEISGRGVGLDAVRQMLTQLDGEVSLHSRRGGGTVFSLRLPISRAVTRAVAVEVAGETYAFPLQRIERLVRAGDDRLHRRGALQYLALDDDAVGLVPLAELLELGTTRPAGEEIDIVVVAHEDRRVGFAVDAVLGEFDLATRPLDPRLGRVADLAALALMPDGAPVVLLDIEDLLRGALEHERELGRLAGGEEEAPRALRRVLVVDDSISVRELVRQLLVARGYEVEVAVDGMDAWARLREWPCDLVVTDVDMPRMDGIELTRSLKQDPKLRALPVVIVSYRDRPEDRARGLEVHADAYLTKADFQEHGFLDVVHQLIGDAEVGA